ncbi:MAG: complex I subunit 5 family protein [Bacillota bacterium]
MIIPCFVVVPLAASFCIILFARKSNNGAMTLSVLAGTALFFMSLLSFVLVAENGGPLSYATGGWKIPWTIGFVLDYLSSFILISINTVAVAALWYSIRYITRYTDAWKYYALFMLMLGGMNGFTVTGDIFNLFVFMEISLLAAYALVAFGCEAEELEAAFKYTVMGSISSTLVLLAIGLIYASTSTLNMAHIAQNLPLVHKPLLLFVYGLLFVGFGFKAALVPFHAWLPDAHPAAPAPISAMLSGVLIKTLGVYALIRFFYHVVPAPENVLNIFSVLGAASILIGVFMAKLQFDIKRLLAFHSVSQIGYIILGLGLGTPLGLLGAVFHLLNHGLFKSLLFLNAGSIEYGLGTRDLREMGGLNREMKSTAVSSMIASLSISGIPPFNGFFSKLILILAAVQAKQPIYALAAAAGSVLTLASFLKVQRYAFYGEPAASRKSEKIPFSMNLAMLFLAGLCILSVVLMIPGIKEQVLDKVVDNILNRQDYLEIIAGG